MTSQRTIWRARLASWVARNWLLTVMAIIVFFTAAFKPGLLQPYRLPDFTAIDDISERKAAFFSYLIPHIEAANRQIIKDRGHLEILEERLQRGTVNRRDLRWLLRMAEAHEVNLASSGNITSVELEELRLRMDVIPPSMALAQAALESGWGVSRFARQGNNLFGIWCYQPGCGMVPLRRPDSATHEVTRYRSPKHSFEDYMRILNSHSAYESLWYLRESLRSAGDPLEGIVFADALYPYSEEGLIYVRKVKDVIVSNGLEAYDQI